MKRTQRANNVKTDNICVALFAMSRSQQSAVSIASLLTVTRQTANNYINELMSCGFIKICGRGRFKIAKGIQSDTTKCGNLSGVEMYKRGRAIVVSRAIEIAEQAKLWNEIASGIIA